MKYFKSIILIFLLSFTISFVFADSQTAIDSLKVKLQTSSGKEKVDILNELIVEYRKCDIEKCEEYGNEALLLADQIKYLKGKANTLKNIGSYYKHLGKYKEALNNYQKALQLFQKLNDKKGISKSYYCVGNMYRYIADYDKALEYLFKSLSIIEEINDKKGKAICLNYIGLVYNKLCKYHMALEYYYKSLNIRDEINDNKGKAVMYNNIGNIYKRLNNIDKSMEYYLKSLEIKRNVNDNIGISISLNNLGRIYNNQKKYDKALDCFMESILIKNKIGTKKGVASVYNNIAIVYKNLNNFIKADKYYRISLNISEKTGNKYSVSNTLNNIGLLYLKIKIYDKAFDYFNRSLKIAEDINAVGLIRNCYKNFSKYYSVKGNYEKSLEYYQQYSAYNDTIFKTELGKKIAELQTKYEVSKKENQIKNLLKEKEIKELEINYHKKVQLYLIISVILAFLLVAMIFIVHLFKINVNKKLQKEIILRKKAQHELLNKNRKLAESEKELTKSINTKDKFFSIIAHDILNPFNSILGFSEILYNDFDSLSSKEVKIYSETIYNSSKNLFDLLNNLLQWSRIQVGSKSYTFEDINLKEVIEEIIIVQKLQSSEKNIQIESEISSELNVFTNKNIISLLLRNLISNAIKFTDKEGRISIVAERNNGFYEVSVNDTGIGISEENIKNLFNINTNQSTEGTDGEKGTGLGLVLCKEFVEIIGGEIWVNSELGKGSTFTFRLPDIKKSI
ncbi:MAG: tetratricopeptide repeat-containing sensor histidine kinase [Bacteroidales bacterium]|nr:tetratricopeptide repeat-containing sensor histidine kinase [Bacteroidales bacterium]